MKAYRAYLPVFLVLAALGAGACAPGQAAELAVADAIEPRQEEGAMDGRTWGGKPDPAWKQWDKLVDEQKFQEAADLAERILDDARKAKRHEAWVRAMVRSVVSRTALHGYETAVRFLRDTPWPEDALAKSVLGLYYAASLQQYLDAYGWEIRQREKVASAGPVDLKTWTADQIRAEALLAFAEAWSRREALGAHPATYLGEYLHANDFPAGIRSTLRDAVTYLVVAALADSSGWTPEQSNEVFRLDLPALLAMDGPAQADALAQGAHPLAALTAALADLEAWHRAGKRPEAALEARLERLRRLAEHFTQAADKAKLLADLRARMAGVQKLPWWAMAKAQEAEFLQGVDAADALIQARDVAREGAKAFPKSPGGLRCASIVAQLERPAYGVEGMAADAPGRRSIAVNHRNLSRIHFRAWTLDLAGFLDKANDWSIFPDNQDVERMMRERKPEFEWASALPATPDLRDHRTYVVPPMEKPAFYVVAASARPGFPDADNQKSAILMTVGDLVLMSRSVDETLTVIAASGETGRPVAGAEVMLYRHDWHDKHRVVKSARTPANGTVTFDRAGLENQSYFVFARKGADVAIDGNTLYFSHRDAERDVTASLIYTDRSVYRPGQKLLFKLVAYAGRESQGKYKTLPNRPATVVLSDANGQEVSQVAVVTNAHGTASGEMTLPAGRLLGAWSLRSSLDGHAEIRVEEYKRPTFEARMLDPEAPLRLNRPATLKGEARYYFGLPVPSGKVAWKVTREPQYPWWWWWRPAGANRVQVVDSGITALSPEGQFTISFTPAADERLGTSEPGVTYRYRLRADVTDEGGETRGAERAFRLGFTAVEASVNLAKGFFPARQTATIDITRTDLDGSPAAGKGTWRLVALNGPRTALLPADQPLPPEEDAAKARFASEGDRLRPRWSPDYDVARTLRTWADGNEEAHGDTLHDAKGLAKVALPPLAPGAWRLRYETVDAYGATYRTTQEFVVAGRDASVPLAAILAAEEPSVNVGGTARVLAHTGLADTPAMLEVWRGGKVIDQRTLEPGAPAVLEFPVAEADRGGFSVALTVLRDHQFIRLEQAVFVPWDDKQLKVEFATFRDLLRPGAKETWTVKVTGPQGKDTAVAAAEVLAYMYDRSLDVFAPHNPRSTLSLYPYRGGTAGLRATVGQAPTVWLRSNGFDSPPDYPTFTGDRLAFHDTYGIGGPGRRGMRGGLRVLHKMAMPMAAPSPAMSGQFLEVASAVAEEDVAEQKSTSNHGGGKDKVAEKPDEARGPLAAGDAPESAPLRSDFSETAFWQPHLLTGRDGTASISFTVPDSVTSWNVWVHAVTREMTGGSLLGQARTAKDLMVRPYVPRFFREGDRAVIKVVVNNASDRPMSGTLALDLFDPATNRNLLADFGLSPDAARRVFTVPASGGTNLSFEVAVPARIGPVAVKVQAVAGDNSDGELRPVPVLPGRMHLMQSRFVTLKDAGKRTMTFADLARGDDPTLQTEQMVVTVDAQLFYSVLSALPYLVSYPYECSEQTLNRFLSTGILTSMFDRYPAVARMAQQMAKRDTQFETFDAPDPNRKMALEETPWVVESRGGDAQEEDLLRVLDPRIAKAQRDGALEKLKKAQTSSGGFPWFPGGPPSPYMTLYVVYGFSKALEFGVDVPRDVIVRAWAYLHRHYVDEIVRQMQAHDSGWEFVTFLGYVLSAYPDDSWSGGVFSAGERKAMLDFGFKHWKAHSPYLKGYLALTLKRMGREKDGRLVWASVMDSAKTAEDQGTFWAAEDRSWLWYNDTIETHAFALRTSMELTPEDPKIDGMVLWLFLNKKLNHWKSTRATAEVVYSLAGYLKATERLGVVEDATVQVGGQTTTYTFQPDRYTGKKNQVVVPGEKVDPKRDATITVSSTSKGMKFASATWHFATDRLPPEARGDFLGVTRTFFKRETAGKEVVLRPLKDGEPLAVGDEVEVHLSLTSKHPVEYVHLRDPRGSGFEPVNVTSRFRWDLGLGFYEEVRDSGENFFFEWLPQGEYTFKYRIRASMAGAFKVAPATVQPMYAPEFAAYSAGDRLVVGTGE